jgi:hypothetical protein
MSFLEIYAPIGGTPAHMFFFDVACVRTGDSAHVELTANDVEIFRLDNVTAATSGLLTVGSGSADGFSLVPLESPIHARVIWVNAGQDFARVLEPIALSTVDNDRSGGGGTWSPLRTAATFFAPIEAGGFQTTLYFVCPNTNIQGATTSAFPTSRFPALIPAPQLAGQTTPLRVLVFDDEESLLRDVTSSCNCLTIRPITEISSVYADASDPERLGTYTEVVGGTRSAQPAVCSATVTETTITRNVQNPGNSCPLVPTCGPDGPAICVPIADSGTQQFQQITAGVVTGGPFAFTGYRAISAGGFDIFNRLNNASRCDIQPGSTTCSPNGR